LLTTVHKQSESFQLHNQLLSKILPAHHTKIFSGNYTLLRQHSYLQQTSNDMQASKQIKSFKTHADYLEVKFS
jgi:hypothetical protein